MKSHSPSVATGIGLVLYATVAQANLDAFEGRMVLPLPDPAGTEDHANYTAMALRAVHSPPPPAQVVDPLRERFVRLVDAWKRDTQGVSSFNQLWTHGAYLEIIGMGRAVLPLIFEELEHKPDWWFWALQVITGQNPVQAQSRGVLSEMTAQWLAWWKANRDRLAA